MLKLPKLKDDYGATKFILGKDRGGVNARILEPKRKTKLQFS